MLFLMPGLFLGILLRALTTRVAASLVYFRSGLANLPDNWLRVVANSDTADLPELVPGVSRSAPELGLKGWLDETLNKTNRTDQVTRFLIAPILFLPPILYRWSLKSTWWFYLPLVYLLYRPVWVTIDKERKARITARPGILYEWVFFLIAFGTVFFAILGWIDYKGLATSLAASRDGAFPLSPFILPFVLNLEGTEIWHWLSVTSAGLTVFIFLWAQSLIAYEKRGSVLGSRTWPLWAIFYLDRLRTLVVVTLLITAAFFTFQWHHKACALPTWFLWLDWFLDLYQQNSCAQPAGNSGL